MGVVLLALLGAVLSWLGDIAGMEAAKGRAPWLMFTASCVLWALCAPVWFAAIRLSDGRQVVPVCMTWSTTAAVLSVVLALLSGDGQTRIQWAGFGVIVLGVIIRAVGGK